MIRVVFLTALLALPACHKAAHKVVDVPANQMQRDEVTEVVDDGAAGNGVESANGSVDPD